MIERKGGKEVAAPKKTVKIVEAKKEEYEPEDNGVNNEDAIAANRRKMMEKLSGKKKVDTK